MFWFLVWFSGEQQGSELSFGGVDTNMYQGQIYWTPVTAETYWQIGVQGSVILKYYQHEILKCNLMTTEPA